MNTEKKGKTVGRILLVFFLVLAFTGVGILLQVFVRQSGELHNKNNEKTEIQAKIDKQKEDITSLETKKKQLESQLAEQNKEAEKAAPAAPEGIPVLKDRITSILNGQQGTWSVYVENLKNGQIENYNDVQIKGAGLLKLYIMGAAYEQMQKGSVPETDEIKKQIHTMIGDDDNATANQVLAQIGGTDYVNQYIEGQGYAETKLEDQIGEGSVTSAADCGKILKNIYEHYDRNGNSETIYDQMMNDLRNQKPTGMIHEGLNQSDGFANKTGELPGVENEAAVVFNENGSDYSVCIMSQDVDNKAAKVVIQKLSAEIYNYFSEEPLEETGETSEETSAETEDNQG